MAGLVVECRELKVYAESVGVRQGAFLTSATVSSLCAFRLPTKKLLSCGHQINCRTTSAHCKLRSWKSWNETSLFTVKSGNYSEYNNEAGAAFAEPRNASMEQPAAFELAGEGQSGAALSSLNLLHQVGDVVKGTYKIVGVLGQGGVGTMYEAVTERGDAVALKAMSLRKMKGWKDMDLFKREARVLRSLQHPSIPEYIDYFEVDTATDRYFYLAQKVATGRSLADLVSSGWRVSEEEVVRIALQVLEVLRYLEGLRPPVVHRDIKPENIILDEASGTVKVVDFGAVQEAAAAAITGSTVVGTYGYMSPEQFQNRATPQSDLYALGATLLFLLSGRTPSSFPQTRLRTDFRSSVRMSARLADVLERMLEPTVEERFQSAAEVIQVLQSPSEVGMPAGSVLRASPVLTGRRIRRPAGTKVVVTRSTAELRVQIPASGLTADTVGSGSFAVAWNAFIAFWTASAVRGGAPLLFAAFSLPFWVAGAGLARMVVSKVAVSVELSFERNASSSSKFEIRWRVGGLWSHAVKGRTRDITSAGIVMEGAENGRPLTACEVVEGVCSHVFGGGLLLVEKEWLASEIADFLELPKR